MFKYIISNQIGELLISIVMNSYFLETFVSTSICWVSINDLYTIYQWVYRWECTPNSINSHELYQWGRAIGCQFKNYCPMLKNLDKHTCSKVQVVLFSHIVSCCDPETWIKYLLPKYSLFDLNSLRKKCEWMLIDLSEHI